MDGMMVLRALSIRACGLILCTALAASAAAAMVIDKQAVQRLKSGETVVAITADDTGEADGHIEAVIDIPAPPGKIFSIMTDCARAMRFVAHLTLCKVLERGRDGLWDVREHHAQWLAILPEMVSVFRSDYVPGREIRFSKVRGDFRVMKGSWRLEPLNAGTATRVFYDARVGIDLPVPAFMLRASLEADVPKLLQALRGEVMGTN